MTVLTILCHFIVGASRNYVLHKFNANLSAREAGNLVGEEEREARWQMQQDEGWTDGESILQYDLNKYDNNNDNVNMGYNYDIFYYLKGQDCDFIRVARFCEVDGEAKEWDSDIRCVFCGQSHFNDEWLESTKGYFFHGGCRNADEDTE